MEVGHGRIVQNINFELGNYFNFNDQSSTQNSKSLFIKLKSL